MSRRWLARLLAALVPVWLGSLRWRRLGRRRVEDLRARGESFVYALWHGDQVLLLGSHRGDGCSVLVSQSVDGSLLACVLQRLGYGVVRGSTSRGAVAGLLGLRRELRRGAIPTFAVDGPRGPAGSVAGGAVALARAAGAWVVPVASDATSEVHTKSWDRTKLPLPLSRAVVVYGRPLKVPAGADLDEASALLGARLRSAAARAARVSR